eukprot:c34374_g1_i1 orf=146-1117(+)
MAGSNFAASSLLWMLISMCYISNVHCQLVTGFYSQSCPQAESIVRSGVINAMQSDSRMPASLLRLHFHDCFVQGCDGSLLLDDNSTFTGEKTAVPNLNSVRGFEVVDQIKSALEAACPRTVSCADILALTARDAVVVTGGPSWNVLLGRRDSTTASLALANQRLPPPTSNVPQLVNAFSAVGLSVSDMVTLSGAHTIGQARCTSFSRRLANQTSLPIQKDFAASLQSLCPQGGNANVTALLDQATPTTFDNAYYQNLLTGKGLLISDQVLFSASGSTQQIVASYSSGQQSFFNNFVASMMKMGNINPLTGSNGQIRSNCRKVD